MFNRLILVIASAAAAVVLAAGLALAGFGPAPAADGQADPLAVDAAAATDVMAEPDPTAQVQVDTIYLAPQATPEVILTDAISAQTTAHHDDDEDDDGGEHEGEDD